MERPEQFNEETDAVSPEDNHVYDMDPSEYAKLQTEIDEKHDEFLCKHLRRLWPRRVVRIVGAFQILLTLAIVGVDLPIILMFAPRWQVFVCCWMLIMGMVTGISTILTANETTWLKVRWNVSFNVLCGVAAAVMMSVDILMLINSNICLSINSCNYRPYTAASATPYYTAQTALGIGLLISVMIMIVLFVKYAIGGSSLFDDIQRGWAEPLYKPMMEPYEPQMEMYPMMPMPPPMGMPPPMPMHGMMSPGPMRMPIPMPIPGRPMFGAGVMQLPPPPQSGPRPLMMAGPYGPRFLIPGPARVVPVFAPRMMGPPPGLPMVS